MNRLLIFAFLLLSTRAFAQVIEYPLSGNPVIKEYLKSEQYLKQRAATPQKSPSIQSAVTLPFIDDFSYDGIYPDQTLWMDSNVFINSNYPDNPITVGVATFDGIDKKGNPYDPTATKSVHVQCDYLTSMPIDLNGLTIADSVYLTFYYQPQGLGIAPEAKDSLTLEFKTATGWKWIWSKAGSTNKPFQKVNLLISDTAFMKSDFQFRFINYASSNANEDHWNLDYVFLDKNRTINGILSDVAFINRPQSLIKEYQSMPWKHFKNNPNTFVKSSYADSVRNIDYGSTTLGAWSNIYDAFKNIVRGPDVPLTIQPGVGSNSGSVNAVIDNLSGSPFTLNSNDTASFLVKLNCRAALADMNQINDTVNYRQKFYDYYAYDDGSAESNFGIPVAYAKYAYKFDIKQSDSIKGVQIYFNPTGWPVHSQLFSLVLWKDITVGSTATPKWIEDLNKRPKNVDSINGFATYLFSDTTHVVNGTIYIGLIQTTDVMLGIGLDKNTDNGSNLLVNFDGTWQPSGLKGSPMIRPYFGFVPAVGIDELQKNHFSISPNPCSEYFSINSNDPRITATTVELITMTGQLLTTYDSRLTTKFNISSLPSGIYFVKISGKDFTQTSKIVVQH